jgi:hypothetical protein
LGNGSNTACEHCGGDWMNIQKFDYSVDISPVILWQYDKAINLLTLLAQKQAWLDENQTAFWNKWFNETFNINADNSSISVFGLKVWSYILNIPSLIPTAEVDVVVWGFNAFAPSFPDYENDNLNFNNAPFASSMPVINLNAPQQHFLILLKYFNCTSRNAIQAFIPLSYKSPSTPSNVYEQGFLYDINSFFAYLCFNLGVEIGYGENTIVCHDNLDSTISYVFSDISMFPTPLLAAIEDLNLFPKPAGISISSIS